MLPLQSSNRHLDIKIIKNLGQQIKTLQSNIMRLAVASTGNGSETVLKVDKSNRNPDVMLKLSDFLQAASFPQKIDNVVEDMLKHKQGLKLVSFSREPALIPEGKDSHGSTIYMHNIA
jgi:hypothetical protein